MKSQTTSNIMMVRPSHFGYNPQTAENNAFQTKETKLSADEIKHIAQQEFDGFVGKLKDNGVNVIVVEETDGIIRPDSIFPNNWITFHHNGTVITYPMYAPSRRTERREDVIDMIKEKFDVKRMVRFEDYENSNQFLEGTGSMILDRINRIVYACLSPRTEAKLLDEFCHWADYKKLEFQATDNEGTDIYHTNVMMAMGDKFVVICMDTIKDKGDRKKLEKAFKKTKKEIIDISMEQMQSFAGNMLQVQNDDGKTFLVMSEQAFQSLRTDQIQQIEKHTTIIHAHINTIEKFGGGSARCMMAEVFLDEKES